MTKMFSATNNGLVELTAEEVAEREVELEKVASDLLRFRTQDARDKRNALLAETDYAALPDTPEMSDAMKTYRQALRDVPAQSGFPTTINWPTLGEQRMITMEQAYAAGPDGVVDVSPGSVFQQYIAQQNAAAAQ